MEKKKIHAEVYNTSREVVKFINENAIAREDIVNITMMPGTTSNFVIFYYK